MRHAESSSSVQWALGISALRNPSVSLQRKLLEERYLPELWPCLNLAASHGFKKDPCDGNVGSTPAQLRRDAGYMHGRSTPATPESEGLRGGGPGIVHNG